FPAAFPEVPREASRKKKSSHKTEFRNFKIVVSPGNETLETTPNTIQQQSDGIAIETPESTPNTIQQQSDGIAIETPESTPNTIQQQSDNIAINDHASPIRSGNQAMPMSWSKSVSTFLEEIKSPKHSGSDQDPSEDQESDSDIRTNDQRRRTGRIKIKCHKIEHKNGRVKRTVTVKLNECDVIGSAINDTIDEFLDELDDNKFSKEFQYFKQEVELRLIEQSDLVDEHMALRSSLQKSKLRIRQLRTELLNVQRHHDKVNSELHKERSTFRMDEENRKKLEQVHTFLSDLELLRISVMSRDNARNEECEILDGFEGLLTSVASRCCDIPNSDTDVGNLGVLRRFNSLLENCEHV
ncbi:15784_t:CDS:2, partial [Cetraspora pellucida]